MLKVFLCKYFLKTKLTFDTYTLKEIRTSGVKLIVGR